MSTLFYEIGFLWHNLAMSGRMHHGLLFGVILGIVFIWNTSSAYADTTTFSNPGTFTWTAPVGITHIDIEAWGGGGGGPFYQKGVRINTVTGGGGAYAKTVRQVVTPGTTYTVTVGHGDSELGGPSWFGTGGIQFVEAAGGDFFVGGDAQNSIGTIRYSGGNGGKTSQGGGGSSAGPSGNGNNATQVCKGAEAVQGGGAGGNAACYSSGVDNIDGQTGYSPGGGGGAGAKYGHAGVGGNGKIIITYSVDEPTSTPTTDPFPSDPGPLVTCSKDTNVSFYYDAASAVRSGVVPFRILLNSRGFHNSLGSPSIIDAHQVPDTPVSDTSVEITSPSANTYIDGNIYMGSADVLTVKFDLLCNGAQGYDYVGIVKTSTWTIPDIANPSISPNPNPNPSPKVSGNGIFSWICNPIGCNKDDFFQFIHMANPFLSLIAIALGLLASIPGIIFNILPQLSRMLQFFGSFFSIHKRKTRWGIVVDSDLGRPISRAIVQVFDAKFHQLKETQITGPDGQFGFLLPSGSYYLITSESGFIFPARKKPPTVLQGNERIYLGEEFESDERDPDKVPHLVVPMDREEKTPAAKMIFWRFAEQALALIDGIGLGFLYTGAAINTFFLFTVPDRMNVLFEVLYLILFALKLYILLFHQKGLGTVGDSSTGSPIDLAIVRLYDAKTNRIVQTRVTNVNGRFFLLVPRGIYTAAVAKAGYTTLLIPELKVSGNSSKALALNLKLHTELSEDTKLAVVPPLPQIPLIVSG